MAEWSARKDGLRVGDTVTLKGIVMGPADPHRSSFRWAAHSDGMWGSVEMPLSAIVAVERRAWVVGDQCFLVDDVNAGGPGTVVATLEHQGVRWVVVTFPNTPWPSVTHPEKLLRERPHD